MMDMRKGFDEYEMRRVMSMEMHVGCDGVLLVSNGGRGQSRYRKSLDFTACRRGFRDDFRFLFQPNLTDFLV